MLLVITDMTVERNSQLQTRSASLAPCCLQYIGGKYLFYVTANFDYKEGLTKFEKAPANVKLVFIFLNFTHSLKKLSSTTQFK